MLKIGPPPSLDRREGICYDVGRKRSRFRQSGPDPAGGIVAVAGIGVILLAAAVPVKLLPELEG